MSQTDRQIYFKMKTLQTLYNYLTQGEISNRKGQAVELLIKLSKVSELEAVKIIDTAAEKKLAGDQLNKQESEIINFFTAYKREKSPLRKMLQEAKTLHASMPNNSKLTVKL